MDFDDNKHALHLLKLADKYGVVSLKMLMEARIVESNMITADSCLRFLMISEGYTCALLYEASLKMVVDNILPIMASGGFDDLAMCPSLTRDVILCQARLGQVADTHTPIWDRLSVGSLRTRLNEMGLT